MYLSEIKGMAVLDKNAKAVGKVEDVKFDPETGAVEGIVIGLKKNLISKDEVEVPFDDIAAIGDYIILKKEIPKETKPVKVEKED
ncbi:MAG: PRC-barrel domain-containing protein [Methanobrevibacter sp.]|uniref:PRC-barrel domain-containing protein n=1 Tax=Methanobrevibacter sp. TaxID=66852 RepID=UPI0026E0CF29|nr:PRC-barrel domain-containing protein [Methanobrevibacter sp.]MDO5848304.1 PRC-barrel domain-containing protein [Methanobrevibacter sp.]